jgi:hypothetical protein
VNDERPGGRNSPDEPDLKSESDSVTELADFALDDPPELKGRVHRSINRRMLASQSLEFSLGILVRTCWDYLRTVIEAFPQKKDPDEENRDG